MDDGCRPERKWIQEAAKRVLDVTAAALGLIVLAPILGIIALAVYFALGRPVLFRQHRPGLRGRLFTMYKFRTMTDARDDKGRLLADDERLTRLGLFLRSTSLDEVPELINVLRGDMSLVGPRPLLPQYLDRYTPYQSRRHEVKPGITGWAQIHGRHHLEWDKRFALDVWYVDHWNVHLDLKILLITAWMVLRREGFAGLPHSISPEFQGTADQLSTKPTDELLMESSPESTPAILNRPNAHSDTNAEAEIPQSPSRRRIYLSPPHMSGAEREMLMDAFDSNWIAPLGPHVDAFEEEFAREVGAGAAVAVSSGTAALHLSLVVLGVGPGDLVATSTLTFAASANAIRYVGATPVFIDSERQTWNMDPELLAEEIEANLQSGHPVKAVLAVDLCGQCADYEPIRKLCRFHGIPLIEDAAEALGATYQGQAAGTHGDIGCFSFNGNKIITTSGGGMLVSNRKDLVDKARFLASQARDPAPHYQHSHIGYNYRMSNLLAAVGRGQLRALRQRVAQRRGNYEFYRRELGGLPGLDFLPEYGRGTPTHWLSCITVDAGRFGATREEVRLALEQENIESRPLWKPMHLQPIYADCRMRGGAVAERLFRDGLCLPSGSDLRDADRMRVVEIVQAVHEARRAVSASRAASCKSPSALVEARH